MSAFDPDAIEEENRGLVEAHGRKDLERMINEGQHSVDHAHIKAELWLGFRDKKQLKK